MTEDSCNTPYRPKVPYRSLIRIDTLLLWIRNWFSFGRPCRRRCAKYQGSVQSSLQHIEQVDRMDAGTFFKRVASVMKENPPAAYDAPALERLKKLGIEPGKDFNISEIDPAIARGLETAMTRSNKCRHMNINIQIVTLALPILL